MRKIMLSLVGILMVAVASCSNPSSSVVIDKSPYEYVLPENVDLNDYTYVGDYVFADSMNFAEWKFANGSAFSEFGYFMVFEKISRVRNDNPATQLIRVNHYTMEPVSTVKATKYKVYLKKAYIEYRKVTPYEGRTNDLFFVNYLVDPENNMYDGSAFTVKKLDDTYTSFEIIENWGGNPSDYVAY